MDGIERDVFEGVGPDGIDVRLYTYGGTDMPSVTTVLKTRDDDKGNLYDWQDRNDGTGDAAHHKHLFWYSRHLGTLGHWHALRELDATLEWTPDEGQSLWALGAVDDINSGEQIEAEDPRTGRTFMARGDKHEEIHDASSREVLYSILRGDKDKAGGTVASWGEFYDKHPPYKKGDYYSDAIIETAARDIQFFRDAQQRLWSKLGMNRIIAVEQFLFDDESGYAGQVDLVYEDENGHTVVADLKSSSGCYDKHQMQGAAYAKAVERATDDDRYDDDIVAIDTVDRLEVHRAHPRTGQMVVHTHSDAPGQQGIHSTKYWNDSYQECWESFERLLDNFDGFQYDV